MFITAVCVIFLIKLRWPKNKGLKESLLQGENNYHAYTRPSCLHRILLA